MKVIVEFIQFCILKTTFKEVLVKILTVSLDTRISTKIMSENPKTLMCRSLTKNQRVY